jgi:hypothetical protein
MVVKHYLTTAQVVDALQARSEIDLVSCQHGSITYDAWGAVYTVYAGHHPRRVVAQSPDAATATVEYNEIDHR